MADESADGAYGLTSRPRCWLIVRGLVRAAATTAVLVALYYLLPVGRRPGGYLILELAIGAAVLLGMIAWQVRAIVRSDYPGVRATPALVATAALFLLLFAATSFVLSGDDPARFTERLSRSDALYFTITVFSTAGFGDISPKAQAARLVVATQMLLDLVSLGLGIRVILGVVQRGRSPSDTSESGS